MTNHICTGCGCTDTRSCWDDAKGAPCHWERLDDDAQLGACSACPDAVSRWDAGDRTLGEPADPVDALTAPYDAMVSQLQAMRTRFNELGYEAARQAILENFTTSYRLRAWLRDAETADPVDALHDAMSLVALLHVRLGSAASHADVRRRGHHALAVPSDRSSRADR